VAKKIKLTPKRQLKSSPHWNYKDRAWARLPEVGKIVDPSRHSASTLQPTPVVTACRCRSGRCRPSRCRTLIGSRCRPSEDRLSAR